MNAPSGSAATFWEARNQRPRASRASASAVKLGATTSSRPETPSAMSPESSDANAAASARVLCIFQLATMRRMRVEG